MVEDDRGNWIKVLEVLVENPAVTCIRVAADWEMWRKRSQYPVLSSGPVASSMTLPDLA